MDSSFCVSKTTYNMRSHSYTPIYVISRHTNRVEPLIHKDPTILIRYAILDHLRLQLANSGALFWNR